MKLDWTKGLEEDHAKEIVHDFKGAPILRRRIRQILEERIEETRKTVISKVLYENPNWAYRQADLAGFERCLREIISLFDD